MIDVKFEESIDDWNRFLRKSWRYYPSLRMWLSSYFFQDHWILYNLEELILKSWYSEKDHQKYWMQKDCKNIYATRIAERMRKQYGTKVWRGCIRKMFQDVERKFKMWKRGYSKEEVLKCFRNRWHMSKKKVTWWCSNLMAQKTNSHWESILWAGRSLKLSTGFSE